MAVTREPGPYSWRNPWLRWSVFSVAGMALTAALVGFVWLPSVQSDFSAQGLWASICRAAGVPAEWGDPQAPQSSQVAAAQRQRSTAVVLDQAMARPGNAEAAGRGATIALQQCTMCHGVVGLSDANAPNLAGQYAEVVVKQLTDYQRGDRVSAVMQALAANLSERDITDLAAHYAVLLKPAAATVPAGVVVPALVRVGDPMRNIAPCASCHGGIDRKLGAPWLEGMPRAYLAAQLGAFATGQRRNDSHAQMRNMARQLSAAEIDAIAGFYARP